MSAIDIAIPTKLSFLLIKDLNSDRETWIVVCVQCHHLTLSHKVDESSQHEEGMKVPGKLSVNVCFPPPGEGFKTAILRPLGSEGADPEKDEGYGGVEEHLGYQVQQAVATLGPQWGLGLFLSLSHPGTLGELTNR